MFEEAVTYQFIGNVTNGAADGAAVTSIAAGSACIAKVDDDTVEETGVSTSTAYYQVVQKLADGTYIRSPKFKPGSSTISGASYVAATEQVSYFGYNATSGDLGTITSGNTYTLSVLLRQTAPMANNTPLIKTIPWKATAGTQYNVANGLATIFRKTFKREPYPMIKCELVNGGAKTAVPTGADDFVFTKGSKTFSATDIDDATGTAALAVGDLLVIGTADSSPVYKIATINTVANTGTFDREYEGDTATIADTALKVVVSASEGDYGLKLTGLNRFDAKPFNPLTDFYSKTSFKVTSSDFDDDVLETVDTAATAGTGTAYEVAQREVYTGMNQGAGTWLQAYSPNQPRSETDLATPKTYDVMTIEATDSEFVSVGTGINPVSKFKIFICTEVSLTGDDIDTALGLTV